MREDQEKEQRRNMIIFFVITLFIMMIYPHIFGPNVDVTPSAQIQNTVGQNSEIIADLSSRPAYQVDETELIPIETIRIDAPRISGTISTKGLVFNDVTLKDYKVEYNRNEKVSVFGDSVYFATTTWKSNTPSVKLPNQYSHWKTNGTVLSPKTPVILTWDNHQGLLFSKTIEIDENFVFTITDTVKNYGSESVELCNSAEIYRELPNQDAESMGFYNGPIGYFDKSLNEVEYADIEKKQNIEYSSRGGWFGITDKYWLVAFIPEANSEYKVNYQFNPNRNNKGYVIKSQHNAIRVDPSMQLSKTQHLFIGAKEIQNLDMYEEKLNVPHFDLVIDFGRLYILTKPLLYAISYTKDLVGNMGLGILLITLILKLILFPLANKSYRSMNKMKDIQPKLKELQRKYENDQAKLGQAVSELYRKEKVNPMGGCLPMFLQWPILFALYKVLYISIEMRQAPFFGWIHDLSIADPWPILTLGGLIPLPLPTFLQIGIWPIIMGASMWIQQKMGPAPADPAQAKVMLLMPIMFTFMFAQLPSGLVIYWTFSNILAILQQYVIQKSDEKEKAKKLKTLRSK
ncbi:MAG: membrane protein insertase YidC [Alphaproteobacteria bacterium]|nr:membrane protein insertase YidC [Alphaproteobacteria bacterium]